MTKQDKINKIYEVIANKELSFWCRVFIDWWLARLYDITLVWYSIENIEWHPVMIWNCDKLIEKWPNYFDNWITILDLWIKKDKPIEEQNEECIDYIFNLI